MLVRYVLADLLRNPRRSLATLTGVALGVGLFCAVLFFVDGLSASMTQRAVAPLAIDMQRIVSERSGATIELSQELGATRLAAGRRATVTLDLVNRGEIEADEVTVRSVPGAGLAFVPGSARIDGAPVDDAAENPFAHGPGRVGRNLGTLAPGEARRMSYQVEATEGTVALDDTTVASSFSTRVSVNPTPANQPATVDLDELARRIAGQPGIAHANPLSVGDLGRDTLRAGGRVARGPSKIFGFDPGYAASDATIDIVEGALSSDGAVLSQEAANALSLGIGDQVTVELPDGSTMALEVTGLADLTRSRSLFSSRRGGDLETFIYVRNAVVVSSQTFGRTVFPAFGREAAAGHGRLKSPPIREIDIGVKRDLLDADPATAAAETERIGVEVMVDAAPQDYLLDNITNTLEVAAGDAEVAKRLFIFLGLPGALLAAILAAYAGHVLAEAQRREQATLRTRGASRKHLLRMLAIRNSLLTAAGSVIGLAIGYPVAAAVLGHESLARASTAQLVTSAVIGTVGGFIATGAGLYLTGRRSIEREIQEDRAQLSLRAPSWWRARLDVLGLVVIVAGTAWGLAAGAFEGTAGSVYFGRAVDLALAALVLPLAAWLTGSLFAARLIGYCLNRTRPASDPHLGRVEPALFRRSVGRRPWAISNGSVVVSLIVALAVCLGAFTASYDRAKVDDARYANGADIKVTPSPTAERAFRSSDAGVFETAHAARATPVVYGLSNVVLRSDRTSDPANVAAVDPSSYAGVAPVDSALAAQLESLERRPNLILVSREMADFLKLKPGDTAYALLARATPEQVEMPLTVGSIFERLPGFPDGIDAVIDIELHTAEVPTKAPDFFLVATVDGSDDTLRAAVAELQGGAVGGQIHIDTRVSTLDRDQSSLAALNIAGLVDLDLGFSLGMAAVAIAIFVFGLLLQRRREYIILRAQGLGARTVRLLIGAEAATVAATGSVAGVVVGVGMGYYFVAVLRPLFVLDPSFHVPLSALALPAGLVLLATAASAAVASRIVDTLEPTELLRDE